MLPYIRGRLTCKLPAYGYMHRLSSILHLIKHEGGNDNENRRDYRGTAPIVGIPLEGEKPFAVRRDLLVNSLKGLKVIDAGVQLDLQTGKPSELVV